MTRPVLLGAVVCLVVAASPVAADISFQAAPEYPVGISDARSAVTGDFNRDGKDDVAVAAETGVQIMLGQSDGRLVPGRFRRSRWTPPPSISSPPT